jgi:methionyl aminopeptidase
MVKPGVSTQELSEAAEAVIRRRGRHPASKGYGGFPGAICASVNEVLVHGILRAKASFRMAISSAWTSQWNPNGYQGDACRTYPVGICPESQAQTHQSDRTMLLERGHDVKEGAHLGDVSHAIQ